jgi:diguanylate cyclase (GGDEF)-like protein
MKAAAAARKTWARRRSRAPAGAAIAGRKLAHATTLLLVALSAAAIACAAIGIAITQSNDSRQELGRRAALHDALDELHTVFGDVDRFDAGELSLIERRAGLKDLRFDGDLAAASGREAQSVHDAGGRIVGWFSWAPDRALIRAMDWLWGLVGLIGLALGICAALAMRATRRLSGSLARSSETVRKLTTEDALTGLPNRRVMLDCLEETMATRRDIVAFALIDIDGFHEINDTLGRAGGDPMLKTIGERLRSNLPAGARFGRFDDDEFAVIVESDDASIAAHLAETLTAALQAPIYMDQMWQITASIGVAQAPQDGTTGDELNRCAGLALRAAKASGRGSARRFVPQIHEEHAERRFFLRELEIAIRDRAFAVHYQPVVAADGGAMLGVEALLRWTHPTRGAIPPSVFIPLAEESGQMNDLGELVLRRALSDGARWPGLFVSVNLSPVQMRSQSLVDLVGAIIAETRMPPARVLLEVTEGILIDNPEEALTRLEALRALGVATALDDFGSGYSSLGYLQKFPFDRLKIDRAFVASLGVSGSTAAIIQSIVTLGHALGMKVLAEGVETTEQRVLLRLAGCDEMQGFLFAKACPAEAIDAMLARQANSAAS